MEYTRLGETGLQVSPVCFGTWRFGKTHDGVVETDREDISDEQFDRIFEARYDEDGALYETNA